MKYDFELGVVATDLWNGVDNQLPSICSCWIMPLAFFMFKTPKNGAETTLYCVLEDKLGKVSGLYYSDCRIKTPTRQAQDLDAARRLWEVSEKMVGIYQ